MRFLIILLSSVMLLQAGWFGGTDPRKVLSEQEELRQLFKENVSDANAAIKRGEFEKVPEYRAGMVRVRGSIDAMALPKVQKQQLNRDLDEYARLVEDISNAMQRRAPKLNTSYQSIMGGLNQFNKKLASIGLSELLRDWRKLSRIKNRFVKKPDASLEKAFNETWTSVTVTITELYLDDEIEAPLFEYLEAYKAYFMQIRDAYREAGYAEVAKVKPLSYRIKMQLELAVPSNS